MSKRQEAIERNKAWDLLTPKEQLEDLDKRLGKGVGAKKQRARIQFKIDNIPDEEIKKHFKKKTKKGKNSGKNK